MHIHIKTNSRPVDGKGGRLVFKGNVDDFGPAIIKVEYSLTRKALAKGSKFLQNEFVALKVLQGLAVPKCINTPKTVFNSNISFKSIAVSYISWPSSKKHKLKPWQAIGVWLFVIEQLCAFRKRRILYTDLKPEHILINRSLSKATIIDFDRIVLVNPKNRYHVKDFGRTFGEMAPETLFQLWGGESALVYSVGLLACSLILKNVTNQNIDVSWKKLEKLIALENPGIFKLIKSCMHLNPKRRPQNYDELFKRAKRLINDPRAIKVWNKLRVVNE